MDEIFSKNELTSSDSFEIKILLVDDQPMIAEAIRRALAAEKNITLHYCNNPTKAIEMANDIEPTLILQDLVMPDVNGLMMVKFFRVNPTTSIVPIIVLSTKEDAEVKSEAFASGVNDYLVKLPDNIELIARIKYHSKAYIYHKQRDAAYSALLESKKELKKAYSKLEALSSQDGLTGIANRRQFDNTLQREWRRAVRNSCCISLLMLDIDFFKNYNDTYGHQGGDLCLKTIASIIKSSEKRSTDLAARYGGEEFALILPQTEQCGAEEIAKTLLREVRKAKITHENSDVAEIVTISIGTATIIPKRDSSYEMIIREADKALYLAKNQGRNQVVTAPLQAVVESEGSR